MSNACEVSSLTDVCSISLAGRGRCVYLLWFLNVIFGTPQVQISADLPCPSVPMTGPLALCTMAELMDTVLALLLSLYVVLIQALASW
jgi:hypothetical protein